ncbi:hypothetical protein [Winogradskyella sp. R77965]|uniref:hypothetical protein n=1 Tax=Winogradskyella sp. R77965 TaxID=3093872 RepID=UPI0037DC8B1D
MRIFKEEQRFNQLWLIILIVISVLVPMGIILATYIKDPNSFSTLELISIIGLVVLASGLIFLFKLTTRIDEEGIHYKFFPFHWSFKIIKWNEIDSAYIRKYDALSEYGGWGLKGGKFWNASKGKAINVSGDVGIQLELKNGKKLLLGTQKQQEVESVLATYKTKSNK